MHDNIIALLAVFKDAMYTGIVLELAEHDLGDYLDTLNEQSFSQALATSITKDVLSAMVKNLIL